jgi:pyruvate,orthophosphate dikinase
MRVKPEQLNELLLPMLDPEAERKARRSPRASPPVPAARPARSSSPLTTPRNGPQNGKKVILVRAETSPEDVARHARRRGHPHRQGRHDQPRGPRRPRLGQVLHRRLRPTRHRRRQPRSHRRRQDATRRATTSPSTAPPARSTKVTSVLRPARPPEEQVVQQADEVGGQAPHRSTCAPTRLPATTRSTAAHFGAEGIGLCRTEHMFFDAGAHQGRARDDRRQDRRRAPQGHHEAPALPAQGLHRIFEAMAGLPVTIRLLDPPLHEFTPERTQPDRRARPRTEASPPVNSRTASTSSTS